ncbi:WSC domain-containing protein [Lactarius indigo]|nr:WSC domain-containing protein [Lactarius indigo]
MHSKLFLRAGFPLAVTVVLVVVPLISATSSPLRLPRRVPNFDDPIFQRRDVLPQGWSSLGCYTDDPSRPTLTSVGNRDSFNMTVENCARFCDSGNYIYAGVEDGKDCHCGNITTVGATSAPPGDCNSPCVGDISETCGGTDHLNLYWSGATPPPQPTFVQAVNRWYYVGCFNDSNDARVLTVQKPVGQHNNSVERCTDACKEGGYSLAGVEFAQQCWCDNNINNGGTQIDTKNCMLACSGNSSEICGGANSLVMYVAD